MQDALLLQADTTRKCLDDGFVRLIDVMPRLVPEGYTPEFAIVQSARVSYGLGLKTPKEDNALIRYLVRNRHTSPLESVKFRFHIRAPRAIVTQILRHRTGSYNEFSQRYAEVPEGAFYRPSSLTGTEQGAPVGGGSRLQSSTNKQGSESGEVSEQIRTEMGRIEGLLDEVFKGYTQLVHLGLAKEIARFYLPLGTYSELYMTMDLHNLLKFLELRADSHAQAEIVVYAKAIIDLIRPLVPVTLETFWATNVEGVRLSRDELGAFKEGRDLEGSVTERREYAAKKALLTPEPSYNDDH